MALLRRTLDQRLGEVLPSPRRESRPRAGGLARPAWMWSPSASLRSDTTSGLRCYMVPRRLRWHRFWRVAMSTSSCPRRLLRTSQRALFGAAALERAGVPFAIAGDDARPRRRRAADRRSLIRSIWCFAGGCPPGYDHRPGGDRRNQRHNGVNRTRQAGGSGRIQQRPRSDWMHACWPSISTGLAST